MVTAYIPQYKAHTLHETLLIMNSGMKHCYLALEMP